MTRTTRKTMIYSAVTIKKQQNELTRHLRDIGFIETQKHSLLHKYAGIVEEVEEFKAGL